MFLRAVELLKESLKMCVRCRIAIAEFSNSRTFSGPGGSFKIQKASIYGSLQIRIRSLNYFILFIKYILSFRLKASFYTPIFSIQSIPFSGHREIQLGISLNIHSNLPKSLTTKNWRKVGHIRIFSYLNLLFLLFLFNIITKICSLKYKSIISLSSPFH